MLIATSSFVLSSCADTQDKPMVNEISPEDPQTTTTLETRSPSTSVYFWTKITELDEVQINKALNTSKINNIDTIYLGIDEYISINEITDASRAERWLDHFNTNLDNFLRRAKSENIKIEALAGGNNWTDNDRAYIPEDLLNFVISYNEEHPEAGFSGLQLDVEFYTRSDFPDRKNKYYEDYLAMVESLLEIKNNAEADHLRLGFAVPYWADENDNKSITKINGIKKPFAHHVIDSLRESQSSYLAIMSYKNYLNGPGGIIDISKGEIDYASTRADENVGVVVALKCNLTSEDRVENNKTSFYGTSKKVFNSAKDNVVREFSDQPAFGGIAIHHLECLEQLE